MNPGANDPGNEALVASDGHPVAKGAAVCDCRKVLGGLSECRKALGKLSNQECLAVLCTLASEFGLSVRRQVPPGTSDSQKAPTPENLRWAEEFVAQVVLSDALLGAALQLDESKQEIDRIAERLGQVVEETSQQLERSEASYSRLFQRVKEGAFTCDISGRFLDVNPAVLELLGYGSKEAMIAEHTFGRLFADATSWEGLSADLLEHQYVQNIECELVRHDGAHVHVLITAMLVHDSDGTATGFEGIWYDVTERQRRQERLIEAQRLEAVRQMVVTYSHEINQPLTALCNYVQLLLERCEAEGGDAEIALAMSEEAAKLAEVMIKIGRIREVRTKPYLEGIEMLDLESSSSDDGPDA